MKKEWGLLRGKEWKRKKNKRRYLCYQEVGSRLVVPASNRYFMAKGKTKKLYNLPRDAIISFFFDTFAPKITCEQLPFILSTPYYR